MYIKKSVVSFLFFLGIAGLMAGGCQTDKTEYSAAAFSDLASALLVPDTELNFYLFAKQDRPTTVQAGLLGLDYDLDVESMSIWGSADPDQEAVSVAATMVTSSEAQKVYDDIPSDAETWKLLRGKKIYLVHGSGAAAEALRQAIDNNRFTYYDDTDVLDVVKVMPNTDRIKLVTIAVAYNDPVLLDFLLQSTDEVNITRITQLLNSVGVKLAVAGLYTPNRINIAKTSELIQSGKIAELDAGILVLVKSDLPGFVLEPLVSNYLTQNGFEKNMVGDVNLYRGQDIGFSGDEVQMFVRVENNYLFASTSGQESYADKI